MGGAEFFLLAARVPLHRSRRSAAALRAGIRSTPPSISGIRHPASSSLVAGVHALAPPPRRAGRSAIQPVPFSFSCLRRAARARMVRP